MITNVFARREILKKIPTHPVGAKNFPLWSYSWVCFHCCTWYVPDLNPAPVFSSSWQGRSVQAHSHVCSAQCSSEHAFDASEPVASLSGANWNPAAIRRQICCHVSLIVAVTICLVARRDRYGVISPCGLFSLPLPVNSSLTFSFAVGHMDISVLYLPLE